MQAERRPQSIHVPSLVLIAQAIFLLECRQTDRHKLTDSTDHSTHGSASTDKTRSHPQMVGDMSRVTLNFDLSKFLCLRSVTCLRQSFGHESIVTWPLARRRLPMAN